MMAIITFIAGGFVAGAFILGLLQYADFIQKIWPHLRWLGKFGERKAISCDIQTKVNPILYRLALEMPEVIKGPIKVQCLRSGDAKTFIRNGEVIVPLRAFPDREENLLRVVRAFVESTILRESRIQLKPELAKAIDYALTYKIVKPTSTPHALRTLSSQAHEEQLGNELLSKCLGMVQKVDDEGLMTRVLVRTFERMPTLTMKIIDENIRQETIDFASWLADLVSSRQEDRRLYFLGQNIRLAFVLFSKNETLSQWGISAHKRRAVFNFSRGCDVVYFLARGKDNCELAKLAANQLLKQKLIMRRHIQRFITSGQPDILIECSPNFASKIDAEVSSIVLKRAPDARIIATARRKGELCKVAVVDRKDLVSCIGSRGETAKSISDDLGEKVEFILWAEDPKEFISNALTGSRGINIDIISLDENTGICSIECREISESVLLRGKRNVNAIVAGHLTGWQILIKDPAQEMQLK